MKRMNRKGFSLIELLVVLVIIILLASISIPVFNNINKGANLGIAAVQAVGQFDQARQTASTMNQAVELRIYETKDSSGVLFYNALATYAIGEDEIGNRTYALQSKIQYLPQGVVFSAGSLSTLISDVPDQGVDNIPGQNNVNYSAFLFRPSGGADLGGNPASGTAWTLTIVSKKDAAVTSLPPNYAVLTLNPVVGITRITRP